MTVKQITSDTADEKIKQLYETAFPEDEQIPWKDLMRLVEEMPLDFTAYYDGEDFIGFTIVYPRKSINWFWYFAVCEKLRGKGYGQKILTQMIEHYKGQSYFAAEGHSYFAREGQRRLPSGVKHARLFQPLSLPAIRVIGEPKSEGKIFPIITESLLTTHIPRWLRKARIRKHITFHCFRHTFAMQLLDKGIDIYTISALLGHKQVSSKQSYAKMTSRKMIEAIVKIE